MWGGGKAHNDEIACLLPLGSLESINAIKKKNRVGEENGSVQTIACRIPNKTTWVGRGIYQFFIPTPTSHSLMSSQIVI